MLRSDLPFAALVLAAAVPSLAADGPPEVSAEQVDCRYATFSRSPRDPAPRDTLAGAALPDNDVFRPLLADQIRGRNRWSPASPTNGFTCAN